MLVMGLVMCTVGSATNVDLMARFTFLYLILDDYYFFMVVALLVAIVLLYYGFLGL